MNEHWHEQIQRSTTGDASPEEIADLQQALKSDAELRALYLDYLNLDAALEAAAGTAAMERTIVAFEQRPAAKLSVWAKFSLAALPLGAAAAVAVMFFPAQEPGESRAPQDPAVIAQLILQTQLQPTP